MAKSINTQAKLDSLDLDNIIHNSWEALKVISTLPFCFGQAMAKALIDNRLGNIGEFFNPIVVLINKNGAQTTIMEELAFVQFHSHYDIYGDLLEIDINSKRVVFQYGQTTYLTLSFDGTMQMADEHFYSASGRFWHADSVRESVLLANQALSSSSPLGSLEGIAENTGCTENIPFARSLVLRELAIEQFETKHSDPCSCGMPKVSKKHTFVSPRNYEGSTYCPTCASVSINTVKAFLNTFKRAGNIVNLVSNLRVQQ